MTRRRKHNIDKLLIEKYELDNEKSFKLGVEEGKSLQKKEELEFLKEICRTTNSDYRAIKERIKQLSK